VENGEWGVALLNHISHSPLVSFYLVFVLPRSAHLIPESPCSLTIPLPTVVIISLFAAFRHKKRDIVWLPVVSVCVWVGCHEHDDARMSFPPTSAHAFIPQLLRQSAAIAG